MQNGLSIDLSQLDSYSIDKKAGTLTVGGGAVVESIVGPAYEAGFELRGLLAPLNRPDRVSRLTDPPMQKPAHHPAPAWWASPSAAAWAATAASTA